MKIVDLIGRDMLVPSLVASDKRGILEELAGHIAGRHSRIDRATLTRILIDREALASTERVAIVKVAIRQRTQLACLRVRDGVIVLQTLKWPDEVRAALEQGLSALEKRPRSPR